MFLLPSFAVVFSLLLPRGTAVTPLVDVGYTRYQGTALPNGVTQWLGIRYAAPPLGNLRFRAPSSPLVNKTTQIADQVSARFSLRKVALGMGIQEKIVQCFAELRECMVFHVEALCTGTHPLR